MNIDIDWQSFVFESNWLSKLDRLAAKRFGQGGLAEEASTYVIEQLSENNWHRLSGFKGQSKPDTFLFTITGNYLEEFSRKRYGRPRPPEWLKRQGEFWVQVWKHICLERQLIQSVIHQFSSAAIREPSHVKEVITTIKARIPSCGQGNREVLLEKNSEEEGDDMIDKMVTHDVTPVDVISDAYYADVLLMVSCLFRQELDIDTFKDAAYEKSHDMAEKNHQKLREFRFCLKLSDEEKILLKMVFEDGLKKSVVAKALGMQAHLPGRIIKKVLSKISDAMQEVGIDFEEIRQICD